MLLHDFAVCSHDLHLDNTIPLAFWIRLFRFISGSRVKLLVLMMVFIIVRVLYYFNGEYMNYMLIDKCVYTLYSWLYFCHCDARYS